LVKEETVLQGIIDRLTETGQCHGMEMNVEKVKVMTFPRQPSAIEIVANENKLGNVECFKYLGTARCRREIVSRIAMANAAFNKKKDPFSGQLDLHLREKLVKCYIWSRNC
jgi:hypothetical protein